MQDDLKAENKYQSKYLSVFSSRYPHIIIKKKYVKFAVARNKLKRRLRVLRRKYTLTNFSIRYISKEMATFSQLESEIKLLITLKS